MFIKIKNSLDVPGKSVGERFEAVGKVIKNTEDQ
jgi:hypothetical protein